MSRRRRGSQQLQTNIVRLRAFSGNLGDRFVMVNIPAAAVETVENGVVYSHHAAGVGKIDRQSPIMQTKATADQFQSVLDGAALADQARI